MSDHTYKQGSEQLLPVKETAARLGISVWTLYSWSSRGRVASHKLGTKLLFSTTEVQRLIDESERPRLQCRISEKRPSRLTHGNGQEAA